MQFSNITNAQINKFLLDNGVKQKLIFIRDKNSASIMGFKDTDEGVYAVLTINKNGIKLRFNFIDVSSEKLNFAWKKFMMSNNADNTPEL